jgi:hypothetical protein
MLDVLFAGRFVTLRVKVITDRSVADTQIEDILQEYVLEINNLFIS